MLQVQTQTGRIAKSISKESAIHNCLNLHQRYPQLLRLGYHFLQETLKNHKR